MSPPVTVEGIPRRGRLRDEPLPKLLCELLRANSTGTLSLSAAAGTSLVWFRDGFPVAVDLPGPVDRLGSLLVATGVLDQASLDRSLASSPGVLSGRALVNLGRINREQLIAALRLQLRRRLHRLFFLDDAEFKFEPGSHDRGVEGPDLIRADTFRAIHQGVKSAWDEARFGSVVGAAGLKPIQLTADRTAISRFGFKDAEARVVELLAEEPRAVAELVMEIEQPDAVHAVVYTLLVTESAEVVGATRSMTGTAAAVTATPAASTAAAGGSSAGAAAGSSVSGVLPLAAAKAFASAEAPVHDHGRAPASRPSVTDVPLSAPPNTEGIADDIRRKVALLDREDYFQLLGVGRKSTKAEIKAAYISAAMLYHPDRLTSSGLTYLRPDAERIFRRVSEAYQTLSEDSRRAAYEAKVGAAAAAPPPDGQRLIAAELAFLEGELAFKRRDFTVAVRTLQRSVDLNPQEGEAIALLAWAQFCAGQTSLQDARPDLERAVTLNPKSAKAHYYLGMVLKQIGEPSRAMASFRRATELDPRLTEAQSELRVLTLRQSKEKQSKDKPDSKTGLLDRFRKKS